MILQGMSGCGWVKTIDMSTGYGLVKRLTLHRFLMLVIICVVLFHVNKF
jgi:hypothetical protein